MHARPGRYHEIAMNKNELAARLAEQEDVTPAEAADQLDRIAFRILKKLRRGEAVELPGLGRLLPGRKFQPKKRSVPK
jgi:nucleoid DNA-binding protein